MRPIVAALLLVIASAAWSQTADRGAALALSARCGESAPADTVGMEAPEQACPGITQALDHLGYLALLPQELRDELDGADLLDLLDIEHRYSVAPDSHALDPATLAPILASLQPPQSEQPLSLFERFKRWLRDSFDRQQADSESWLSRWLQGTRVPDAVSRALIYASIVLVLVLALAVVINELRAAGVFRRRAKPALTSAVSGTASTNAAALEMLRGEGRAPALLRMLVRTLVHSGRLRAERSLTHRELCEQAAFDDDRQRERFRYVALLAERTLYAGAEATPEEIEAAAEAARALNAQLSGARA